MKKRVCMLYLGNPQSFYDLEDEHRELLFHYSELYNVDTFCIFSDDTIDIERLKDILNPREYMFSGQYADEIDKMTYFLVNHALYAQNLKYMSELETTVIGKQEMNRIIPSNLRQYVDLKKGIEMIEKYERNNEIQYDIFVKTQFDFMLKNYYDFDALWNDDLSFNEIITCKNNINESIFSKALDHYKITSIPEYIDFLKNTKIDLYASRIYTKYLKNLNMCGRYVKNYDTINKIYYSNLTRQQLNNIVYFVNDWFFFTKRINMSKFKYFISSFGQNKLEESYGTHIMTPEYQLFSFCKLNKLLPIVHLNSHQGGIYKTNVSVMNEVTIPNGKTLQICSCTCMRTDPFNIFFNTSDITLRYVEYYCYDGEPFSLSFEVETIEPINLIMRFVTRARKEVLKKNFKITHGQFKFDTILNFNDLFYITLNFNGINPANSTKISDVKITHDEARVHYLTFLPEYGPTNGTIELETLRFQTVGLSEKYLDSCTCLTRSDFDIPDERKYISLQYDDFYSEKFIYNKWKPYVIYKYLCQLRENDILIYRDMTLDKGQQYLKFYDIIKKEVTKIMANVKENIFFAYDCIGNKSVSFQKKYVSDILNNDQNEFFINHDLIDVGTIICKNTEFSRSILEKWLDYCQHEELLDDSRIDSESIFYKYHMNEQAILNAIIIKMKQAGELDWIYPYYASPSGELNLSSYSDLRRSCEYHGFVLNKMPLVTNIPQYSNGSTLHRKRDGELHFIRNSVPHNTEFQWIGYDFSHVGCYMIRFDIKFKKFVPEIKPGSQIGIKKHFPMVIYNDWIKNCKVDQWETVTFQFVKQIEENDTLLLIFDEAEPFTEFELKDFILM